MATEASTLLHTSNAFHHQWAGKLAELLVTLTQKEGGLGWATGTSGQKNAKVFFANSGTEANEGALKTARKVGKVRWAAKHGKQWDDPACDKYEIVCFDHAFHGRSMGALSVTTNAKYQKPFFPLIPGVQVGELNDLSSIERLVGEKTCAVIVEPVQGEGGIHPAHEQWLRALRKRCDETGAVLIFDEIQVCSIASFDVMPDAHPVPSLRSLTRFVLIVLQCGLYRTGTLWAHSTLPTDCHPDIVTMAKPLANGYPIGAVLMRDSVAEPMTTGTSRE